MVKKNIPVLRTYTFSRYYLISTNLSVLRTCCSYNLLCAPRLRWVGLFSQIPNSFQFFGS